MARHAKTPAKRSRATSKPPEVKSGELVTLLDFVRFAASRFVEAKLTFAHGTSDPVAEAAFAVCETLHLHPDMFETFAFGNVRLARMARQPEPVQRSSTSSTAPASSINAPGSPSRAPKCESSNSPI